MPEVPYIKKLETVGDFDVWEVDGMFIRNNINREFTNFGQHYRFPFIPKHEFWIDREYSHDETFYFVSHMLTEWELMDQGVPYIEALGKAAAAEAKERKKTDLKLKAEEKLKARKEVPKEIYVEKMLECTSPEVWVVNGELVRTLYFNDFTEGGHCFVYDFVPQNQVWIDDDLTPKERGYVLLHELHERYLMSKGQPYHPAHNSSSNIEYKCRRDPSKLAECLEEEVKKNQTITTLV